MINALIQQTFTVNHQSINCYMHPDSSTMRPTQKSAFHIFDQIRQNNWATQPKQRTRGLKLWVYREEGSHILRNKNKGAYQQLLI